MVIIGDRNRMGIILVSVAGGVRIMCGKILLLLFVIVFTMLVAIAVSAYSEGTDKDVSICLFVNNKNGKIVSLVKRTRQNATEIIQGLKTGGYEQVEELPKNISLDVRCLVITVHDVINPLVQCGRPWEPYLVSQVFDSAKNTTLHTFAGRKRIAMQCPYYGTLSEFIDKLRNKVRTRREIYFSA